MARLAVKAKPITTVGDATLVSKNFALKFLRQAFVKARIQRVETPKGTRIPPNVEGLGPIETWQVWAGVNSDQGIIEVTAPRLMLPYAVVREAYRCRLQMDVRIEKIANGVRLTAEPMPQPSKPAEECEPTKPCAKCEDGLKAISEDNEPTDEAVALAAHHSITPDMAQAALDAEAKKP